jgi:hypothetical protein
MLAHVPPLLLGQCAAEGDEIAEDPCSAANAAQWLLRPPDFLEDSDAVILFGYCKREGFARIEFQAA